MAEELIDLRPLPTRIFGVGLHKTATTSLHEALKILGFDSLHWGTGEAPLIWYEMNALGRSKTLEQWYALSDLPIPLLYKKLDKAYPGSKFILTVRNETDWLLSVSRLWDRRYNHTRHLWDVYPISNQLHTALYGRKDFDAQTFLERYRWHNKEVRKYFRSRPDDLLVLDMDQTHSWKPLCTFLDRSVPSEPYPWSMRTRLRAAVASMLCPAYVDDEDIEIAAVVACVDGATRIAGGHTDRLPSASTPTETATTIGSWLMSLLRRLYRWLVDLALKIGRWVWSSLSLAP
jgi:Sulfotransferase domain